MTSGAGWNFTIYGHKSSLIFFTQWWFRRGFCLGIFGEFPLLNGLKCQRIPFAREIQTMKSLQLIFQNMLIVMAESNEELFYDENLLL